MRRGESAWWPASYNRPGAMETTHRRDNCGRVGETRGSHSFSWLLQAGLDVEALMLTPGDYCGFNGDISARLKT